MSKFVRAVSLAAGLLLAGGVCAKDYPSETIRLVNPYQAGGGIDLLARLLANKMQEKWGQPVVQFGSHLENPGLRKYGARTCALREG